MRALLQTAAELPKNAALSLGKRDGNFYSITFSEVEIDRQLEKGFKLFE